MKVLLIDNTRDVESWGSEELRHSLSHPDGKASGIELLTVRAPHQDLPTPERLSRFDRIVLSGSATSVNEDAPWIENLLTLIRSALSQKIPLLGICYGHQSLARAIGGKGAVGRAPKPEIGWTSIQKEPHSSVSILSGLPQSFYSFSMHYDEVRELPRNAELLARSELCGVQAFQLKDAPAFGVQFHPERTPAGAEITFAAKKKLKPKPPLLHPGRPELYDPSVIAQILKNFYSISSSRAHGRVQGRTQA